jgi:agmatine deiminase
MSWRMPIETGEHKRTWMAFPREGTTLGGSQRQRAEGYAAWTAVAHAVADFEPVTMMVDPTEMSRARRMLSGEIEIVEAPLDEFWMRDAGPTFVVDDERPGALGAVDWIFNGWGAPAWAEWEKSAKLARLAGSHVGAELVTSVLVNEGGGIHVDGEGTVLLTETVQLDQNRNPHADKARVEDELLRTIGATHAVWLPRGLTRDYDEFGTKGHVDIVAAIPSPGVLLLHNQRNQAHPDYVVTRELSRFLAEQTDAAGRHWNIVGLPAPATLHDDEGFVDWSYVNHYVVNDGVIACAFGDERADSEARDILSSVYPGRQVRSVDSRAIFARGGGIHCITQQEPLVSAS